ncbi:ADP-ribosylglycohydrolase family protein [Schaalia sp. ZJ405]|uniref:ADP-ribosylglycohydrolase family protein n=1 Tax=Schaalia sp. ZJ405 TaxID=2709403 RepID=UPI0013EA4903|nr:ADP-ribosylglycohydrolase family protein [Schaalia sp. ZJ405]QPK80929.1 ADP-ribosylglycohydrolase family protein [Schaalia sp. ZJ405]
MTTYIHERAQAVIAGAAVGDALGGATEGWTPQQIRERWGGLVKGIVEPYYLDWEHARPIAPYHKGDGHVTDDTLMTSVIIDVYAKTRRHLTAYDMASEVTPRLIGNPMWIPELESEKLLLQRIFLAEKWIVARLHYGHVDPREAGVGNIVNCGAAMYMAPVGVVNAGDPQGAYNEAIDMAGAHQSSYGREAAGVYAGAVAHALIPSANADGVLATAIYLAHDGTKTAIEAVVAEGLKWRGKVTKDEDIIQLNNALREAVKPFDTVGDTYREMSMDARRPSRTKAIEELPIALGLVAAFDGDYKNCVLSAINYGRDADSIAVMAGAICAALGGIEQVPDQWINDISLASNLDLRGLGKTLGEAAENIMRDDHQRLVNIVKMKDTIRTGGAR